MVDVSSILIGSLNDMNSAVVQRTTCYLDTVKSDAIRVWNSFSLKNIHFVELTNLISNHDYFS